MAVFLAAALQAKFSLTINLSRNLESMPKMSTRVLSSLRKPMAQVYGVDGCLLLAVESLYSCSEVYILVGGVKPQSFIVGIGLRQGCVLSVCHHSFSYFM